MEVWKESLEERIESYKTIKKDLKRTFIKVRKNDLNFYTLPNGISILNVSTHLEEGKRFKSQVLNVGFDFEVIENRNGLLIIKNLNS